MSAQDAAEAQIVDPWWVSASEAERQAASDACDPALVDAARKDPAIFAEFVLRDETTGRPVELVPLQFEWFDAIEKHGRLVILTSPESGKSQNITIARTLWRMGQNPTSYRAYIGSKIQPNARKFTGTIRKYIEGSPELRAVFPRLRPGRPWSDEALFIDRGALAFVKDPTVAIGGACANVTGSRFDDAVLDDVIDQENTQTEYRADQVTEWIIKTLESRMLRGGKIILLCNAWEEYDAAHKLSREHGWHLLRSPVRDPVTKRSRWPKRWPQERIDSYPPAAAAKDLDCIARKPGDREFQEAWIQKCLQNGNGLTLVHSLLPSDLPDGCWVCTGVDLATRKNKKADETVLFTILVYPEPDHRLQLLWIEAGRWGSPEIKARIEDHFDRYRARFHVEDNAAQIYIVQDLHLNRPDIEVEPFTTDATKHHPVYGVTGIAAELSMGWWIIPCMPSEGGQLVAEPETEKWLHDMRTYDRNAHMGDRLAGSWFAREGARRMPFQHSTVAIGDVDKLRRSKRGPAIEKLRLMRQQMPSVEEMAEAADREVWAGMGFGDDGHELD